MKALRHKKVSPKFDGLTFISKISLEVVAEGSQLTTKTNTKEQQLVY